MRHHRRRADGHRHAEAVLTRRDHEGLHPRLLRGQPRRWYLLRRPARPHGVHLEEPGRELLRQIRREIGEATRAEKRALDETNKIFHGTLLMGLPARAEFHGEPVVDRHRGQDRIPDRPAFVMTKDHRPGIVEHHAERHAT